MRILISTQILPFLIYELIAFRIFDFQIISYLVRRFFVNNCERHSEIEGESSVFFTADNTSATSAFSPIFRKQFDIFIDSRGLLKKLKCNFPNGLLWVTNDSDTHSSIDLFGLNLPPPSLLSPSSLSVHCN